jgi:hypothetical protein
MTPIGRRPFLAAAMGAGAFPMGWAAGAAPPRSVILILLVGGPSGHETLDPKPDAPEGVRGPFGSIATRVPGVRLGEHLPRLAARLDRVTLVRSLHHDAAPVHETGLQLLQAGRLGQEDAPLAPLGGLARVATGCAGFPPFVVLPRPLGFNGVAIPGGQEPGPLGGPAYPSMAGTQDHSLNDSTAHALGRVLDLSNEPAARRDAYGRGRLGRDCLAARRLVEAGSRFVVVNAATSVFNEPSFDVHGAAPFSTMAGYARLVGQLDRALAALLDDLEARGRLGSTLVVAAGEFGRTPHLNARGGRDHWTRAASAILAGGGMPGGRVIGATDALGGEPTDEPIAYPRLHATMRHALGLDPAALLARGVDPNWLPSREIRPIS